MNPSLREEILEEKGEMELQTKASVIMEAAVHLATSKSKTTLCSVVFLPSTKLKTPGQDLKFFFERHILSTVCLK